MRPTPIVTRHQRLQLLPVPAAQELLDRVGPIQRGDATRPPNIPPTARIDAWRVESVRVLALLHPSADVEPMAWIEVVTEYVWGGGGPSR